MSYYPPFQWHVRHDGGSEIVSAVSPAQAALTLAARWQRVGSYRVRCLSFRFERHFAVVRDERGLAAQRVAL